MTDLDDLRAQFADIRADFDRLMFGMRKVQFNWRPAPGRWSIGDCLAHLNAVDSLDADLLEAAVRQARAKGLTGDGPFRYSPVTGWLIRSLEPPPRFRTRAPRIYLPPPGQPMLKIRGDFIRIHDRLIDIAGSACRRAGDHASAKHRVHSRAAETVFRQKFLRCEVTAHAVMLMQCVHRHAIHRRPRRLR